MAILQINNKDIAKMFDDIADILETHDANYYRIRAYRQAGYTLKTTEFNISDYIKNGGNLTSIPTIGSHLATKIKEIVVTGHCKTLDSLSHKKPFYLVELLDIPGLGPKRIHALYHELGVHTPEQILKAAKEGRVKALDGFGEKIQARIVNSLEQHLLQE